MIGGMIERILFIEAINADDGYKFPGAGVGYLTTALRRAFGDERFDIRMTPRDFAKTMDELKPDVVAISSMTVTFPYAQRAAREAKERGLPVMIGGVHISLVPSSLNEDMDVGVIGEGEEVIVELVRLLDEKGEWAKDDLKEVQGVCYHSDDGTLIETERRPAIDPLDQVGQPAWDVLPRMPEPYVLTSRGCPYKCAFCSSAHYWRNLRFHSPEHVIESIELAVVNHEAPYLWFLDDLLIADRERLEEIARMIRERGLHERVGFAAAGARANLVDQELLDLLKSMNVLSIGFGVESASPRCLEYLKGSHITIQQNAQAIELARLNGFITFGYLIIGTPGETVEDARMTLRFARKYLDDMFHFTLLTPLPGTPVWDLAKRKDLVSDDMDWGRFVSSYKWDLDNAILVNDAMTRDELKMVYGEFLRAQKSEIASKFVKESLRHPQRLIRDWLIHPRRSARGLAHFISRREQAY